MPAISGVPATSGVQSFAQTVQQGFAHGIGHAIAWQAVSFVTKSATDCKDAFDKCLQDDTRENCDRTFESCSKN